MRPLIVETGIHLEVARLPIHGQEAETALAIRTSASSRNSGRKFHAPFQRLLHLSEAPAVIARGCNGCKTGWLLASDVTNGIQRINTQIEQGSTTRKLAI